MDPVYTLPPVFRGETAETLPQAGEVNWGMETFAVERLRSLVPAAAATVKLGVVDTGVDAKHPILANVKGARDFTGSRVGSGDVNGHGTHCQGTVGGLDPRIGVAAGFPMYHGKGLGDGGSGGGGLIPAIEYCLSEGCGVVSNSWGGGGQSSAWERRFREWAEHPSHPWLVFSGPNTPDSDWPGRSPNLLNVAALNPDLSPASFSSAGAKLDTSGPGVNIWSARPGGGFQKMSGTSMATPFVAGLLGLYRAALVSRGLKIPTIYELRALLASRSTDTHTPGDDRRTGPGWVTPLLLSLTLEPDPPKVG
jgi:subtilisin